MEKRFTSTVQDISKLVETVQKQERHINELIERQVHLTQKVANLKARIEQLESDNYD